jgi:hypothetical protein
MAITKIQTGGIPALAVTHDKLHTTMDLSGKTVTLPTLSSLNTTGSVGIGTDSIVSYSKVTIYDASTKNPGVVLQNTTTGQTSNDGLFVGLGIGGSGDASTAYVYHRENGPLVFATNNTERMRIDSAGRLSLGPDASDILIDPASTNSNNNLIYMRGNASGDKSSIQMNHYGNADYHIGVGHVADGKFNIANDPTGNDFVIDTSGNVGINNTSPLQKLSINGRVNSDLNQDYYGAWFEGNTGTNGDNFFALGDWYSSSTYFEKRNGESYAHIYNYNGGHDLVLQAGSGANGRASTTAGNVGIGTTTPSAELDVDGDIRGNSFNGVSTGTRNLLINGDMQIAQRSTNAVLSNNAYQYAALDRWGNYYTGNQIQRTSVDIASSGGGTPNKNAMRITRASSNGHLYTFQFLEGLGRLLRINTPFSVSFKARASKSGSAVVQMRYGNSGAASTAADNDIDGSVSLTTSWQTFKYDNLTHNRDYTNAGIWLWGIDSNFAAVGDWIEITDFQLELGPKCTPYEQKTEGMEFLACMRYYQKLDAIHLSGSSSGDHGIFMGHVWGAGIIYFVHHFNVPMRTGPTLKLGQSQATTGNWFSAGSVVQTGSLMRIQSANQYKAEMSSSLAQSSFTPGNSCWMRLYNSSAWLAFDAEI